MEKKHCLIMSRFASSINAGTADAHERVQGEGGQGEVNRVGELAHRLRTESSHLISTTIDNTAKLDVVCRAIDDGFNLVVIFRSRSKLKRCNRKEGTRPRPNRRPLVAVGEHLEQRVFAPCVNGCRVSRSCKLSGSKAANKKQFPLRDRNSKLCADEIPQ